MQGAEVVVEHFDVAVIARAEAEQAQLVREVAGQVITDKTEVIVLFHDVAGGIHSVALDDFFPHRKPEMIRVDVQGNLLVGCDRPHDIGMTLDGVDVTPVGGTKSASRSNRACQYEAQPSFMIWVAKTG